MGLEAAWVILLGCGRVTTAIRQDVVSRMMESHRMMPMPASHAVLGYIMGATSQAMLLFAATFMMGMFTSSAALITFERWAAASMILLTFAMFMWCVSALSGFLPRGAGGIVWMILLAPLFGEGGALSLLPGLTVLVSPIIGRSVFEMNAGWSLEWTYVMALAGQALFGSVCLVGAMRRYRRVDAAVFGTALGLGLLAVWAGLSFAGIRDWSEFRPTWARVRVTEQMQVLASISIAILLAILPVTAAARATAQRRRQVLMNDPAPMPRLAPWFVVVAAATALIVAVGFAPASVVVWRNEAAVRTAIVVATGLTGIYFVARWCYRFMAWAFWPIAVWMFVTWFVPLLVDMVRFALSSDPEAPALTVISGCGLPGALGLIWSGDGAQSTVGIGVQVAVACVPLIAWLVVSAQRGSGSREIKINFNKALLEDPR